MWVLAHGEMAPRPDGFGVLGRWAFEPVSWLGLALAAWLYVRGSRAVAGWPASRRGCWLAGIAVTALALTSPIATYAHALFWVHMVQHLLLTLVAAPLLVLGAPVSLAVRALPAPRRRRVTKIVHSRFVGAITTPLVAWCLFALVMWLTHFSPLYDRALEDGAVHLAEHAAFLGAGVLFWWPLAGLDPGAAGRMSHPMRLLYLLLALPQQSLVGLAIYSAGEVLYPHYATVARAWGPSPLEDQRIAGVVMWVVGDMLFLVALVVAVIAWMRFDDREAERIDRRLGLR